MKKNLILIIAVVLFLALVSLFVFKIKQNETIPQKSNIDQINQTNQEPPIINNLALSSFPVEGTHFLRHIVHGSIDIADCTLQAAFLI